METKNMNETKPTEYVVVCDPNGSDLFLIHAAGCKDLGKARIEERSGRISSVTTVTAVSAKAALEAELNEDFSGRPDADANCAHDSDACDHCEHPARNGYSAGSYGAAGFTGRILPCAKARR